jgi:hypothetical protein
MGVQIKKPNPYDKHLVSTPVTGTTTVTKSKSLGGGVKEESLVKSDVETVNKGLGVAKDQLHMIEVGGGQTINLGNYESARIDVRITVPCTKDDLEAAYEWASDWVSAKIQEAVSSAKGE